MNTTSPYFQAFYAQSKKDAKITILKINWNAWLAELVEHVALDLGVMSSSPRLGVKPTLNFFTIEEEEMDMGNERYKLVLEYR